MHEHWEVSLSVWREWDVSILSELLAIRSWVSNFHEVDLLTSFSSFLLTEAEEVVLVASVICDGDVSEASSITL